MKTLTITLSVVIIVFGLQYASFSQTTLILKTGTTYDVIINYSTNEKISFTIKGDTTKEQYLVNRDDVIRIDEETSGDSVKKQYVLNLDELVSANNELKGYGDFPVDLQTGRADFTEVVPVEGKSAEQLYLRAKEWMAVVFADSKSVVDFDDKTTLKIIGKNNIPVIIKEMVMEREAGDVEFTVTLQFREGRYKYSFSNFLYNNPRLLANDYPAELEKSPSFRITKKNWRFVQTQVKNEIGELIESLHQYLQKTEESEEW